MKIAVDAMGGDCAPEEIVLGVVQAIDHQFCQPGEVVLVGIQDRLAPFVDSHPLLREIEVCHAPELVAMGESPTGSLRNKPNSSIQVALRLVQQGTADAFISAGNTGAVVASAWALLGRLPGVRRPGIAVTFESATGPVTMLDVGANVHAKPLHLFHYALMAAIFTRDVLKVERPTVALLNIGEEDEKGNQLVRETRELFESSDLNFVGNIEGNDILSGRCNVMVCEGFVGNVVLKVTEGVASFMYRSIAEGLGSLDDSDTPLARALKSVAAKLDYAEYGGAPLLGVNGTVLIMHGRSDRRATANALRVSRELVQVNVNQHIKSALERALSEANPSGGAA